MIRTKTTTLHVGTRVDIIGIMPSSKDQERVEIRFCDNGSVTWLSVAMLTEDVPGEISSAIDDLKEMQKEQP